MQHMNLNMKNMIQCDVGGYNLFECVNVCVKIYSKRRSIKACTEITEHYKVMIRNKLT